MKKLALSFLLTGLLLAGAQLAQAQVNETIVINIPFNFYVGEEELPAGEYLITSHSLPQSTLQIRSADGKASVMVMTKATWAEHTPAQPRLVFEQHGDKQLLSAIFEKGNREGSAISTSGAKKLAAASE